MSLGTSRWARDKARSEAMLKWSEPQNRILSGETGAAAVEVNRRWLGARERRTGAGNLHSMASDGEWRMQG